MPNVNKKDDFIMINTRACARGVITVIVLCVCVCVCVSFSTSIKSLYSILNMAIGFTLDLQDFQLAHFAEKASFVSSGRFRFFLRHGSHFDDAACRRPFTVYVR